MEYIRKVFYLNIYEDGICGESIGFAKVSKKGTRLRVEMTFSGVENRMHSDVYLVLENSYGRKTCLVGTVTEEEKKTVLCLEKYGDITGDSDIVGIMIVAEGMQICGGVQCLESDQADSAEEEQCENDSQEQIELEAAEETCEEEEEIISVEIEPDHDEAYQFGKIFASRPGMYPFDDDEMQVCVQISPVDFSDFPKAFWRMGSNSFLLQGYYNYRHLLLARDQSKIYIGIPGQYHRRDKYLAEIFGFGRFKGVHNKSVRLGDFGYWLMTYNVPEPSGETVCCK